MDTREIDEAAMSAIADCGGEGNIASGEASELAGGAADAIRAGAASPAGPGNPGSPVSPDFADLDFELGWDYARHGVAPPAERVAERPGIERGYRAGQVLFGDRAPEPGRFVRKWLQLRLGALERGRAFDVDGVTPDYLESIDVPSCPILRQELTHACQLPSDWSIDRIGNDGDYAAGNLAVMSTLANQVKRDYGFRDALRFMAQSESVGTVNGLDAAQWARLAVLMSFVEPLDDSEAASLPMLVLPPPGVDLVNPLQVLQAQVSVALLRRDYLKRSAALRGAVPGKALRGDFDAFVCTWRARVVGLGRETPGRPARCVVEDAWRCGLVLRRWRRFARGLGGLRALRISRAAPSPPADRQGSARVQRPAIAHLSEEHHERVRAFVGKRAPRF